MPFFPGLPQPPRGLLARYFPPLAEGVAAEYAARHSRPSDLLFDPFGQSAQLALEAALTGRRLLAANLNPVARFALRLALDPLPETVLRAALTRLADLRLDGERLEVHLQNLFRTTCAECGAAVYADYFEWDKDRGDPVVKVYYCSTEGAVLARPTDPADLQAARRFPARSLNSHWALDRVTPTGDPDREHAAEALAAYTPRALHALVLLAHKFEALGPAGPERRALEALLLAAFDEAASIWPPSHEAHTRPRTIHPPARFREFNPWRALENAVANLASAGHAVRLCTLDELLNNPWGGVCLLPDSAREAARRLPPGSVRLGLTALPRPNPAFWGLSALWAAWLWGREAAAPIKAIIHHKRSDFDWHAQGLRRALEGVRPALAANAPLAGLLPDAEAGLVEATLAAADTAGFELSPAESAYRADPAELQCLWRAADAPAQPGATAEPEAVARTIRRAAVSAACALLLERGEAARWPTLLPGVWLRLAAERLLRAAALAAPEDPIGLATQAIAAGLLADPALRRFEAEREADLDEGAWWVRDEAGAAEPLADRVEHAIWQALAVGEPVDEPEAEAAACRALPAGALQAPGRRLVRACLASYAVEAEPGAWQLRPEDEPVARAADRAEISAALTGMGQRLGYQARALEPGAEGGRVEWHDSDQLRYAFIVQAEAALGRLAAQTGRLFAVLPGGRAGLAAFKLQRDPRLAEAAQSGGWGLVKFRHVRRMAADPGIDRAALAATIELDPVVEKPAAQIPLL